MKDHIRIRSTFDESQDSTSRVSPTFKQRRSTTTYDDNTFSSSSPTKSQYRKTTRMPRTQHKPLYASSSSPYKQLREYYQQQKQNSVQMNQRLMNRYSFINTSLKGFNQLQVSKKGGYSSKLIKQQGQRKSKFFNNNNNSQER